MLSRIEQRSSSIPIFATDLLPRVVGVAWDATSPARPLIHYRFAEAEGADGVWIGVGWERIYWKLVVRAEPGPIELPELPDALSAWRPATAPSRAIVTLFDRRSIDRWSEVRTAPSNAIDFASNLSEGETMVRSSQAWDWSP